MESLACSNKTLNILLMEDDPEYVELVRYWLSAPDPRVNFSLEWVDSLSAGKERLSPERLAKHRIDVVLLDLGLPDSSGMWTYMGLKNVGHGLPVILLSATTDESIALEAIQHGAQDYLLKDTCSGDQLKKALWFADARHQFHTVHPDGGAPGHRRVVGIVGAHGGAGTTTMACQLAVELRRLTGERVLLIDAVMDSGMVAFHFGLEPKHSVLDAVLSLERMDGDLLNSITQMHEDIHVIPSPSLFGRQEVPVDSLRNLISVARFHFDWLVLDLGRLSPHSMAALVQATDVLLVCNPAVPGLYEAKRLLYWLTGEGDGIAVGRDCLRADRVKVVINQGAHPAAIRRSELDQIFGAPVFAHIPRATDDISMGFGQQSLPPAGAAIRQEIARLAQKMAGLEVTKRKSFLQSLLGESA